MTPSTETVTYTAPKVGALARLKFKKKPKPSLRDRLTSMRAQGAFGKKRRAA